MQRECYDRSSRKALKFGPCDVAIGFSELKLKLMASIVAISAIKLLEGFMDLSNHSDRELYWLAGIHLTFVVSTLFLPLSALFSHHARLHGGDAEGV
jgi:uncharacterized protein (TIGR00645 family)